MSLSDAMSSKNDALPLDTSTGATSVPETESAPLAAVQAYHSFRDRVDGLIAAAWKKYHTQMQCRAGCTQCCRGDFKISVIEAFQVRQAVRALPEALRAQIIRQVETHSPDRCPLLVEERCSIYADRPILCRLFGFPIRVPATATQEEHMATCELNFQDSRNQTFTAECFDQKSIADVLQAISRLGLMESGFADFRYDIAEQQSGFADFRYDIAEQQSGFADFRCDTNSHDKAIQQEESLAQMGQQTLSGQGADALPVYSIAEALQPGSW